MIRHCVLVRLRDDVPSGSWGRTMADLAALVDALPGALSIAWGPNVSPEAGMDHGFSEGFVIDFEDATARDAYLAHPEHVRLGARIVAAADRGTSGVLVFDLEVDEGNRRPA